MVCVAFRHSWGDDVWWGVGGDAGIEGMKEGRKEGGRDSRMETLRDGGMEERRERRIEGKKEGGMKK